MVALALVGVLALTRCRGKSGDAAGNRPARQDTVTTTTQQGSATQTDVDLSNVDQMLNDVDKQMNEADKPPADED